LSGIKALFGLSLNPQFYQLDAVINVTPVGDQYKVVNKGGWFPGTTPTKCWQLVGPYTGTTWAKLDGHTKEFLPITLDLNATASGSWSELVNQFKQFYSEFAQKVKNDNPDPKSAVIPVISNDFQPAVTIVFKQKQT
jgi:hypothetical protein